MFLWRWVLGSHRTTLSHQFKHAAAIQKPWDEQTADEKKTTLNELTGHFTDLKLKNVEIVGTKETQYPAGLSVEVLLMSHVRSDD